MSMYVRCFWLGRRSGSVAGAEVLAELRAMFVDESLHIMGCAFLGRGADPPRIWGLHGCTMMQQCAFHVSFAQYSTIVSLFAI